MLLRVLEFLPSLVPLLAIAILYILFTKFIGKKYKNDLESISWIKTNLAKVGIPIHLLTRLIGGPVLEELIFRAPLVIYFDRLSNPAWISIIISSTIFSLIHLKNPIRKSIIFERLYEKYKKGDVESDHLPTEMEKMESEMRPADIKKELAILRTVQLLAAFAIGICAGYFGIKNQSLWIPVIVHMIANTAGLILAPIAYIVIIIVLKIKWWIEEW